MRTLSLAEWPGAFGGLFFFLEMTLRESNWLWSVMCSQARGYWSPLCTIITRRSTWTRGTLGTLITRRTSRTLHFSNVGHLKNHFISISRFSWKKKVGSKCVKQRLTTPMLSWSLTHNSSLTRDNILHLHSPFQKKGSLYHIWKDFLKTINKLWAGASPRHVWFTSFIIFTYRLIQLYYILPVSLNRSPNCGFIVLKQVQHFTQLVVCYGVKFHMLFRSSQILLGRLSTYS